MWPEASLCVGRDMYHSGNSLFSLRHMDSTVTSNVFFYLLAPLELGYEGERIGQISLRQHKSWERNSLVGWFGALDVAVCSAAVGRIKRIFFSSR